MVKILFVGDTHLDIEQPPAIARQRKKDFQNVFEQIINFAISNNVDLICHLGDLFDNPRPSPFEVGFVLRQLLRLAEKDINFYVIRGNHEGSADIEDLFRGWAGDYVKIPNLHTVQLIDPKFDESRHLTTIGYRDFSNSIRIYGMGYYRSEIIDVVKKYIPLTKIDSSKINILLMHCFIGGINDKNRFTRSDHTLPSDDIIGLNFNLIALGHSHSRVEPIQEINTTFFSPGSPAIPINTAL